MVATHSPQRILVTGGAGFIGSHSVELLLKQGKDVIVLDNLSSGKMTNLDLNHPNLEFIEGDVLEYFLLEDLLARCDAVLHLAAIASVPLSIENPIYSFQVNTQGLLHVLQAIHKTARPIRLVYASSAAVYGDTNDLPCKESAGFGKALSPYALQKIHDEDYANLYAHLHGVKSVGLRYFNVYGERQDPNSPYSGVISRFLAAYQQNQALTIFGDGEQSRDFIHVKDVARANLLALESNFAGAVNIATGHAETLLHLVKYIESAGGKPAEVLFEAARLGDIRASYAAIGLASQKLGFTSAISLKEGIKSFF